jgi:hypothetical protein
MPCYSPHHVFEGPVNSNGRISVLWKAPQGTKRLELPCGRCVGCLLNRSKEWAYRSVCEAQCHSENSFITLTFDDVHLPANRSLDVRVHQDFMRRLRKFVGRPVRFLMCGEYGSELGRPHYHYLLFGFDFADKVLHTVRAGNKLFRSKALEKLWPFGFSSVGEFSVKSAAYVSRYVLKKQFGSDVSEHYVDRKSGECLVPEFNLMSRRPGIGARWFEKFKSDVFPRDEFVVGGRVNRPPRFFFKKLEEIDPQMFDQVKAVRAEHFPRWDDNTGDRLLVKEQVKLAQISMLKRDL